MVEPGKWAAELQERLKGRQEIDRRMLFVGLLNRELPKAKQAVLVGGTLVQFYSAGVYESLDIDLVGVRAAARPFLKAAGFVEDSRGFDQADMGLYVDFADRRLRESDRVVSILFEGLPVPAVTLEDAIVDRLLAAKFWKSSADWDQALVLFAARRKDIDETALRRKAVANRVDDLLPSLAEASELAGA